MKRHPALVPLSQDHHRALVSAQRLRRATAQTAAEAARAFREHWETGERVHFRVEEEVLLPAFAAHVDLEERELFPLVEATLPEDALAALGDRLRAAEAAREAPPPD